MDVVGKDVAKEVKSYKAMGYIVIDRHPEDQFALLAKRVAEKWVIRS